MVSGLFDANLRSCHCVFHRAVPSGDGHIRCVVELPFAIGIVAHVSIGEYFFKSQAKALFDFICGTPVWAGADDEIANFRDHGITFLLTIITFCFVARLFP